MEHGNEVAEEPEDRQQPAVPLGGAELRLPLLCKCPIPHISHTAFTQLKWACLHQDPWNVPQINPRAPPTSRTTEQLIGYPAQVNGGVLMGHFTADVRSFCEKTKESFLFDQRNQTLFLALSLLITADFSSLVFMWISL